MADGNLVFNTKIDDTGVDKGTDKISSKMVDLKYKISATEREVARLTKDLEKLGSTKIKSKAVEDLERKVVKAKEKVNSLYSEADKIGNAKQAEFESMGFDPNTKHFDDVLARDKDWQKIQQQISDAEVELSKYERELKNVQATENGISGKDTAEYAEKKNKIADLNDKLNVYKAKLNEIQSEETQTSKKTANLKEHFNKLGKTLKTVASRLKKAFSKTIAGHTKKTNTQMNALQKSLNRIKQAFAGMLLYKVMEGVLKSIKEGIDNLAKSCPTVNKNLSAFISSLAYLKNSLASAFAPIINIVTPILSGFMDTLSAVTNKVGHFIATLTGQSTYTKAIKVQKDYAESLDESAKATENLENTTNNLASFDELNVMQQDNSNNSNEESAENLFQSVPTVFNSFAERLKQAFSKGDFNTIGQLVADKLNTAMSNIKWTKIRTTAKKWAGNIASFLNGAINKLDWFLTGTTIGNGIMTAVDFAYKFFTNFDFVNLGTGLANSINGVIQSIDWKLIGKTISNGFTGAFSLISTVLKDINWEQLGKDIADFLTNIDWWGILEKAGEAMWNALTGLLGFFSGMSGKSKVVDTLGKLAENFKELVKVTWSKLKTACNTVLKPLAEFFIDKVVPVVLEALAGALKLFSDIIKKIKPKTLEAIASAIIGIGTAIITLKTVNKVVPNVKKVVSVIKTLSTTLKTFVISHPILAIVSAITALGVACATYAGLEWKNSSLGQACERLDNLSSNLKESTQGVRDAIDTADSELSSLSNGFSTVDDLQSRLEELVNKGTLTESEKAELDTVADLLGERVPAFKDAWDDIEYEDNEGTSIITGNKVAIIKKVDDVISAYKKQAAAEALSNQLLTLYDEGGNLETALNDAKNILSTAQSTLETELNKILGGSVSLDEYYKIKNDENYRKNKALELDMDVEDLRLFLLDPMKKYEKAVKQAEMQVYSAETALSDLTDKQNDFFAMQNVLNGSYSNLSAVLDVYNRNMIDEQDIQDNLKMSAGELAKTVSKSESGISQSTSEAFLQMKRVLSSSKIDWDLYGDDVAFSANGIQYTLYDLKKMSADEFNKMSKNFNTNDWTTWGTETQNVGNLVSDVYNTMSYIAEETTSKTEKSLARNTKKMKSESKEWEKVSKDSSKEIEEPFTNSFKRIEECCESMWKHIKGILSGELFIYGLDTVFDRIRGFQIGGFQPFAYLPDISSFKIPKLATGAYVPANYGEFLAVLGDNKREAEIIAPESKLEQAIINAMAKAEFGGGDIHNVIYLDSEPIYEGIVKRNNAEIKRRGYSPLAKNH